MREAPLENQAGTLGELMQEGAALLKEKNSLGRRSVGISREGADTRIPGFLGRLAKAISHDDENGGYGRITDLVYELTSARRQPDERLIMYVMRSIRELQCPKILGALSGVPSDNVVVRRPAFMELVPGRIKRSCAARTN